MTMDMSLMGGAGMPAAPGDPSAGGAGTLDEEFTKGFSDMAYAALQRQAPDLVKDVITFRVLDVRPDVGMGVGCFILNTAGEIFFVPVVVVDNQIKPLDVFYSRRLDRYYPLTPEWLREAGKSAIGEMGAGVKAPPTLQTDVDIRNLIVPPTTGRYSYASEGHPIDALCSRAFLAVTEKTASPRLQLLDALDGAPNAVKVGFARLLRKHPRLIEKAAAFYGASALTAALQPRAEKSAEIRREEPMKHDVFVADAAMPVASLKKSLDPADVGTAFRATRLYGFYVKDKRKQVGKAALKFVESDLHLTDPTQSGMYRVWLATGEPVEALVIVNPKSCHSWDFVRWSPHHNGPAAKEFLVILDDGRTCTTDCLMASPIVSTSQGELDAKIKARAATPKNGDYGVFVSSGAMDVRGFKPVRIETVTSTAHMLLCKTEDGVSFRIDDRQSPPASVIRPKDSSMVSLGRGWRFVPCKNPDGHAPPGASAEDRDKAWETARKSRLTGQDICHSPSDVLRAVERGLLASGAEPMEVKMGYDRQLYVGAERTPLSVSAALVKIATRYDVSVGDALSVLRAAATPGAAPRLWAAPRAKTAADAPPPDAGQDPNAQMPMDPAMMAPPPPSGLDLAIAEQLQQIQMQVQALNDKATALQTVQQRAMQIDSGGGAAAAPMGAASMMGGPPPPAPGMPPPGDPSMGMQQQPGMQQPGMQQPGMQQPGMQPGMQQPGMQQPGMQPGMQQPQAPPPVMTNESLSAGDVETSISPQFLDQAGALDDAHVFDAAAVASLAKQKNLRGSMLAYAANLETSLDNLGRLLMLLNLREADLKEAIGNDAYVTTEQAVRDTFKGLGEAILNINQVTDQAATMKPTAG